MKKFFLFLIFTLLKLCVFAQTPVADFSADKVGGCSPIVVNFTDRSTGSPTSWSWDFGNGSTSTRQNPSTTYFTPGTYTVTLTVTNANGSNTIVRTDYITVYDPPSVDFSATNRTGCTPAVVQFSDISTTPPGTTITSWTWDFGDGSGPSASQNPSHVYRSPGSYTVTLTIRNDKGCSKVITKPNYINPSPGVNISFNYVDPGVCSAPATINYTNNSTGPGTLTYLWDLGNGNTATSFNASTTYTQNGTHTVHLYVTSNQGCDDSTTATVVVGRVNTSFTIPSSICPKASVRFVNTSNPRPIQANWVFSNGTTDNHFNGVTTFATSGTYTVTLINTYTVCTDTLVRIINVSPAPTLNFVASDTGKCQPPLVVNFTNNSNGSTYSWDFGDNSPISTQTSPSHTYNNIGNYTVTLIANGSNGCSDTLKKPNYIKISRPVITFPDLPKQGCIPYTVNILPNIQTVDTVVYYNWNFGDGSAASNSPNPTHTYTAPGTYAVTLTITTRDGCTETYTLQNAIKVGPKPTANFIANTTSGCADPGIQFTNQSTNATQYLWQFSDGTSSTAINPQHTFSDTGRISVTLIAFNNGCGDTLIKNNYVYILPSISKFDYRPDCTNPLLYTFTDRSILANSWHWDFGDGTTYNGQNPPVHSFPALGTYNISLTTTNGSCTYTLTRTIVIATYTPDFVANATVACKPMNVSFTATIPNSGMFRRLVWDFGDRTAPIDFGQLQSGQHTYTTAGAFTVTLNAIDSFGCSHTITKNNYIRVNGPTANFGALQASGCKGLVVTFTDSTITDGINSIVNWKWDFGDGSSQTYSAPPFQHQYDSIGNYDVKLVVTDSYGCKDSILKREFVKISILKAKYNADYYSCPGGVVSFQNNTASYLPYTSWWSFGDTNTSTLNSPGHAYADTGRYTVTLVVTDILGCVDTLKKVDSIYISRPKASFSANNLTTYCPPFQAIFTNTSYFYNSSFWDLSIGTSTQQNPSLYYTNTGTYPIKLVVTSPGGCKDSVTQTLTVNNPNSAFININPKTGCRPLTVNMQAFSPMNSRFVWDFGDGEVIDTTLNAFTHVYDNTGTFIVKVILMEPEGCVLPLTATDSVDIFGVKAKFNVTNRFFCDSGYVSIIDSTTSRDPIIRYTWNFGDGTQSNSITPNHQYTAPGFYTISLIAQTANGCFDTAVLRQPPIKVVASPLISIRGDSVICANDKINYSGLFMRPDTVIVQWRWQFPNGNTSTQQNPITQQFTQPGTYTIQAIAINSSGCTDTATKSLLVHALPTITVNSPLTKLVGIPLTISPIYSSGVVSYLWRPSTNLDCANCPSPTTTTKFNTLYKVEVVDSNGCKKDTAVQIYVLCQGSTVFVPNTFSPNGDGSNDIFYVRGKGLDRVKSFRIFNRWGQVVFEQKDLPVNDPAFGWDGRYKGNRPQSDVYVYQLEVFCENGEVLKFEGNVTLIQ